MVERGNGLEERMTQIRVEPMKYRNKLPTTCAEIDCRPVNDCKSRGTRTSSGSGSAKEISIPSSSYIITCPMFKNLEKRGDKGIDKFKIESDGELQNLPSWRTVATTNVLPMESESAWLGTAESSVET